MNTNEKLETMIENKVRVVKELREQLAFENAELKQYRIALDVLNRLDESHALRDSVYATVKYIGIPRVPRVPRVPR